MQIIGNSNCTSSSTLASSSDSSGCDPYSLFLLNLVIFFSYLGLAFATLGALSALLTARTLLEVSSHAQDLMDQKYSLDEMILGQRGVDAGPRRTQVFDTCRRTGNDLFEEVDRHRHVRKHHASGQFGVISFILLGAIFFFSALIFWVVHTQSRRLWIPFTLIVGLMVVTLVGNEIRTHPRLLSCWTTRSAHSDPESDRHVCPKLLHPSWG